MEELRKKNVTKELRKKNVTKELRKKNVIKRGENYTNVFHG